MEPRLVLQFLQQLYLNSFGAYMHYIVKTLNNNQTFVNSLQSDSEFLWSPKYGVNVVWTLDNHVRITEMLHLVRGKNCQMDNIYHLQY